jgi:4-nitrophenyl phosphatase
LQRCQVSFPFRRARHLLIDLDGVLYRGGHALDGADRFVKWMRDHDVSFRLVTNNATLTPAMYVQKLAAMGIGVSEREIFTSALATASYLRDQKAGRPTAFVIGEEGLITALREAGVRFESERPDWVVVGLDRGLTYDNLSAAALALEAGARFIGTNPDTSYPTERGLLPGAGAIQAAITATTGVKPIIMGKPEPFMLELATRDLGAAANDTVMLGDRLDTDIRGANALGMRTILVLTGVSRREDLALSEDHPSLVVDNLDQLLHLWSADSA